MYIWYKETYRCSSYIIICSNHKDCRLHGWINISSLSRDLLGSWPYWKFNWIYSKKVKRINFYIMLTEESKFYNRFQEMICKIYNSIKGMWYLRKKVSSFENLCSVSTCLHLKKRKHLFSKFEKSFLYHFPNFENKILCILGTNM